MGTYCHECRRFLDDPHRDSHEVYRASLAKKLGDGSVAISNQEQTFCNREYEKIIGCLLSDTNKIDEKEFFVIDDRDAYEGHCAPSSFKSKGYQFLRNNDTRAHLPKSFTTLVKASKHGMSWFDFDQLKNGEFVKARP